jgi:predicted P-loop ATPase
VLAFNEFAFGTVVLNPAPWGVVLKGEWTDHEDRLAAEWLQRQGVLVSVEVVGQAVQTAARDHPFHPVKTYLQGLHWDGVVRVDRWRSTYLGAEDTEYSRRIAVTARCAGGTVRWRRDGRSAQPSDGPFEFPRDDCNTRSTAALSGR